MGLTTDDDLLGKWQNLVEEWDSAVKIYESLAAADAQQNPAKPVDDSRVSDALDKLNDIKRRMDAVVATGRAQRASRKDRELVIGLYTPNSAISDRPPLPSMKTRERSGTG
jgi:hypothetical protein